MAEDNYSLGSVVGGSGYPIFYSLDKELNGDLYFENSSFVALVSGATATVVKVTDSLYSDNVLHVVGGAGSSVFIPLFTFTSSQVVSDSFFGLINIKVLSGSSLSFGVSGGVGNVEGATQINNLILGKNGILGFVCPFSGSGISSLYLFVSLVASADFYIYFASARPILGTYIFDIEQEFLLDFEKVIRWEKTLATGHKIMSVHGWRPKLSFSFDLLTPDQEASRKIICEAASIGVIPKNDSNLAYICQWDGSFKREYFANKMIGYTGSIYLESVFLYSTKSPVYLST